MDINEIANAAAVAVATAMATDGWNMVRATLARLLGNGNDDQEQGALAELEEMHKTYTKASPGKLPEVARDVTAELRGQLRSRLRSDPSLAAELQVLTEEISRRLPARENRPSVFQVAHSEGSSTIIQAGNNVTHEPR